MQINTARALGYGPSQILLQVRIPAALPEIMTGVQLSAGIALLATVATEMLVGGSGIGYLVYDAGFSSLMPQMFALMVVDGVCGLMLGSAVAAQSRRLVGWQTHWSAMGDRA